LTAARRPKQRWRLAVLAVLAVAAPTTAAELDREQLERFEGRPVTRLELVGHEVTKDFVVERELETGVGQPFCLATLEADLVRLENLNIFASVDVTPEADADGLALELELKEMPPLIPFVSFQYTEENGFSAGPALSASNLLGRDIQLSGRAHFGGTQTYWARLSYPWITGNHISLDFYGAHLVRDDTLRGFEERSDELTPWLGTYLGDHGRLRGAVSLFRMRSDVDDVTLSPDNDDTLVRLGVALGWDSRDSWRSPHRGWQNELEVWRTGGFLGGDGDFWSMNLDIRRFQPGGQRGTVVAASARRAAGHRRRRLAALAPVGHQRPGPPPIPPVSSRRRQHTPRLQPQRARRGALRQEPAHHDARVPLRAASDSTLRHPQVVVQPRCRASGLHGPGSRLGETRAARRGPLSGRGGRRHTPARARSGADTVRDRLQQGGRHRVPLRGSVEAHRAAPPHPLVSRGRGQDERKPGQP